ncbi:MAG: hypothetical protein RR232_06355 [Clostridia bacterium]
MTVSFEICTKSVSIVVEDALLGTSSAVVALPRGIMQDGFITDIDGVCRLLSPEIAQLGAAKVRQCEFVLPASFAITQEVSLPRVKKSRILPLLRGQLEGGIADIGRYVVDYIPFSDDFDTLTLLAVLMEKKLIGQYIMLAERLSLKCTGIQLRFARLRRMMMQNKVTDTAFVIADIMPGEAELSLFEGGSVFVRSVRIDEADSTLSDWGIAFASAGPDITQQAAIVADGINSLIQFQDSRNRDLPVSAIYATGDTERYKELLSTCSLRLGRSIGPLNQNGQAVVEVMR